MHIPVTLLTGYLGAGKTTIINALLSQNPERRFAVLVNDFGAINVDASLIKHKDGTTISLTNGCVCCSINDDIGTALDAQRAQSIPPEQVLLEASGVADPRRIATLAGHWPGFKLDAVIAAVDCETIQTRARDKFVGALVKSQIKAADFLVLTKTDLVNAEDLGKTEQWLDTMSVHKPILKAPYALLDTNMIMGPTVADRSLQNGSIVASHPAFSTSTFVPKTALHTGQLAAVLQALPPSVHRVKGIFIDAETGLPTLMQCVGRRFDFSPAPATAPIGLVMISANSAPDIEQVRGAFEQCQRADRDCESAIPRTGS
ncbi:GTP-binding protein [Hoeflea sp. AS60]|uniref:CobW family GTP-binding protein n=1 Tax=Hoeflea sp. AS60 TaxID=3135780 RepID=UPI00318241D5